MFKKIITLIILLFSIYHLDAQMDSLKIKIDLRTRGELDNGVKTLIPENKSPEFMVSSRARLGIEYNYEKLQVYLSAQDVRVWGETATATGKNQHFTLHEAWAKYQFSPRIEAKLGRQILSYDDDRLIGVFDWTMHGRSFDAVKGIFKISPQSKLEAVLTYNNDDNDVNDSLNYEIYGIWEAGEITKSLQVLHYSYNHPNQFRFSAIAVNNVLQNPFGTHFDILTVGMNLKKYFGHYVFFGSVYYQTGKNTAAQSKSAYQFSLNADFILSPKINLTAGTEWLSGKSFDTPEDENKSFSPLYGTNHNFNGFMDYFYAGNHFNSFGLNDYYIKGNFRLSGNSLLTANFHLFTSNGKLGANAEGENLSSFLGNELDLVFHQKVGKLISFNLGHSFLIPSDSMKVLKEVTAPKGFQTWTWIGFKVAPEFNLY